MHLFLALSTAAALSLAANAKPAPQFPRMSGQMLVDIYASPPGVINDTQLSGPQQRQRKLAQAYIDGVHDASIGVSWCPNGIWNWATIDEKVILALRELPPEKLKQGAGLLVVEILHEKLPCPSRQ